MIPIKPFVGSKPWAIVLCKFSDHPEEPQNAQFFRDFVTRGNGGINDYFADISSNQMNLDGSQVFGWFNLPYTLDDDKKRPGSRYERILAAVNAVQQTVDFRPFYGICVMLNATVDSGGLPGPQTLSFREEKPRPYGLVVLDNLAWGNTWAAQEMAHGFSLDHSWSSDPDVEYGNPFDVMSAFTNNYGFDDTRFAVSGPGMNAPNLDLLGWLPPGRIFSVPRVIHHSSIGFPFTSTLTTDLTVSALGHPDTPGLLAATINAKNVSIGPFAYYIEFRKNDRWDRALDEPSVVIHQVRLDDKNYLVSLARGKNHLSQGEIFNDATNEIKIQFVSQTDNVATIRIISSVTHSFREAVDGPNQDDWHIYERVLDILHIYEKARVREINLLVREIKSAATSNSRPSGSQSEFDQF